MKIDSARGASGIVLPELNSRHARSKSSSSKRRRANAAMASMTSPSVLEIAGCRATHHRNGWGRLQRSLRVQTTSAGF